MKIGPKRTHLLVLLLALTVVACLNACAAGRFLSLGGMKRRAGCHGGSGNPSGSVSSCGAQYAMLEAGSSSSGAAAFIFILSIIFLFFLRGYGNGVLEFIKTVLRSPPETSGQTIFRLMAAEVQSLRL
jgi:hypothetical protein